MGTPADVLKMLKETTGQPVPETKGAVLRCALESIAMKFRHVLKMGEELAGGRLETIHIVGGGTLIGVVAPQGAQHAYGLKRMAADGFNENGEIVVISEDGVESIRPPQLAATFRPARAVGAVGAMAV